MYPIDSRTTVQEHFNPGRETIDTGLDSLKSLLVWGRIVAPSEHRQAVLNETMHQIQCSIVCSINTGWDRTNGYLTNYDSRVTGIPDMYSVGFRGH